MREFCPVCHMTSELEEGMPTSLCWKDAVMMQIIGDPQPYLDEDENGRLRTAVSCCGFSMFVDDNGKPVSPMEAQCWLAITSVGFPCHDDPLLYGGRFRNPVGWLEPETNGRAPIDAWPQWFNFQFLTLDWPRPYY